MNAVTDTYNICKNIAEVEIKLGAQLETNDHIAYLDEHVLNFEFTKIVYLWATGNNFVDVCQFTKA